MREETEEATKAVTIPEDDNMDWDVENLLDEQKEDNIAGMISVLSVL